MTEGQIEQLFRNTLDPNVEKRSQSEEQLKKLARNKEFVYSLPESFMKSTDSTVRLVSATFFKNSIANDLEINIVKFACQDELNSVIYGEIIRNQVSKKVSYEKEFQELISLPHLDSKHALTCLLILDAYSDLDRSKFTSANTESLMGNTSALTLFAKTSHVPRFRSIMSKIFENYHTAPQFLDEEFIKNVIDLSIKFTDKDSASLLVKVSMRVQKMNLATDVQIISKITKFFLYLQDQDSYKAEYFIMFAQNDKIDKEQKENVLLSLIESLIIPQFSFNEGADSVDDLQLKYNYTNETHNSCSLLFCEIYKFTDKKSAILQLIEKYCNSKDPREHYLAISLFSQIEHLIQDTPEFANFIKIFSYFLNNSEEFIKSEILYTFQFIDFDFLKDIAGNLLEIVINSLHSTNLSLKTNAMLCLPIFLSSEACKPRIENNIELIINSLIHNPLHLEAISETLEIVMENFNIADYAVNISQKMLESINFTNIETTTYMRILSSLVLILEEKKQIVLKIYEKSIPTVYHVLNKQEYDFYVETVDFLSNILYVFKAEDGNISKFIDLILSSDPKELIHLSEELTYLLDNYISYCNVENNIPSIIRFVSLLCYQEDEYIFEDDFIAGCRIMESLILNNKMKGNKDIIKYILKVIFDNYHRLENNSLLYALEIIANAFNIDVLSGESLVYETIRENLNKYVTDMNEIRKRFKRVHDKKIGLLFCSNLMRTNQSVDLRKFNSFFLHLLLSYDQAEMNRFNLKEDKPVDIEENAEFDESSEEYLEEDIYFSTPLDDLDIKMTLRDTFNSLKEGSLGSMALKEMTEDEKKRIKMIIDDRQ